MSDAPVQLDVMAVGAHPDDVEIGCGGTLARLVSLGYKVGIVDLTDGEPTPHSSGPEQRMREARSAAEVLGVTTRITLDLPNRRLFDNFESRVALATLFRKHRPRMVIGFGEETPLASPDHWQAKLITDAAVFYSRLTKWNEHFGGLAEHTIPTQLYYSLAFYSLTLPEAAGHVVSDITDTLETKIASVRAYASQFPPAKGHIFDRLRAIAVQYGLAAGFGAGELFFSPRVLGTRDLMKFVRGE